MKARAARKELFVLAAIVAVLVSLAPVWAQAPTPSSSPSAGPEGGGALVVVVVVGLIAIIGIAVKVSDFKRRRTDAAIGLQGRIADVLLTEPLLARTPIAVTAHTPLWGRSPVILEVSGIAPKADLKELVIAMVMREAMGSGFRFRIEDRLVVDPKRSAVAA